MTTEEFANKIRTKYPTGVTADGLNYADLSDEDLTRRIVTKYPVYESQIDKPGLISKAVSSVKGAVGEFVSGTVNAIKTRGETAGKVLERGNRGEISAPQGMLRVAGEAAGAVGDVGFEALKLIAPKFVEDIAANAAGKIADTEIVQAAVSKYNDWQTAHPEAAQDLEAVFNIASLLPMEKAISGVAKVGGKTLGKVSKITGEVIDDVKAIRIASASSKIDGLVGKVVQGTPGDIAKAKKALASIDITGIKTYGDLKTRIDDVIEAIANKVDGILESAGQNIGTLKPKDLVTQTKVGNKIVKQNFVDDALNQLDELYTNIKDTPARAKIAEIKTRFKTEGITLKEANDIAREYSREFGNKAFNNKTGEALTSVNAQAFENTRKGIKNVVREKLPDGTTKMLDERMGNLINTSRLVGKMETKVNALWQRAKDRGILERISNKLAGIVDKVTFKTASGFVSRLLPSNVGLKTMNSIDLESVLSKNLSKIEKLLKTTDDKVLSDGITDLIKETVKVQPK